MLMFYNWKLRTRLDYSAKRSLKAVYQKITNVLICKFYLIYKSYFILTTNRLVLILIHLSVRKVTIFSDNSAFVACRIAIFVRACCVCVIWMPARLHIWGELGNVKEYVQLLNCASTITKYMLMFHNWNLRTRLD